MNVIKELVNFIVWYNNIALFSNMGIVLIFYFFAFLILFLENAIIPAIFLPGDSLLIVFGVLISKGILDFVITLGVLTIAVGLGSWIGYLQGKFLKNNKFTQLWLSRLPLQSYQKVHRMFNKYGLCVLFFGRFIAFLRTVLPTVAGISGLNESRFQLFNWISSFTWVSILIALGMCLSQLELVKCIF